MRSMGASGPPGPRGGLSWASVEQSAGQRSGLEGPRPLRAAPLGVPKDPTLLESAELLDLEGAEEERV